ncbi:hypothetical protein PGKDCPLP_03423 [Stenotrophomonas maltophilia]|jgi:hypothetical protein|nr:hypothetical protein PAERUG_E15_London_28_01_14_10805 [Pseudomonas aeruginosa]VUM17583.1 hypothetical protein PGKDCPLP_03423 [Stenotrophomonas maltophilia]
MKHPFRQSANLPATFLVKRRQWATPARMTEKVRQ